MAGRFSGFFKDFQNLAMSAAVVVVVFMLLLPLPGWIVDTLMIFNIFFSLAALLLVVFTPKSSSLSSFPRIILFLTLYGLGLNVSSTRLILSSAKLYGYERFPGTMLKAFSSVVAGESLAIGLIIFIILIIVQAFVITKGSGRISEVAARFALDSMPQKNFAVDSELQSGAITDEQAREKKREIQQESDFYSAMDGAAKFVSGNVKAGIFITVIDIVAGIIIGTTGQGAMSFGIAANTYTRLTIGDGLLSQLPSLLVSVATGLLVAGSNTSETMGSQVKKEFSQSGWVYVISGVVIALMSLVPGFPWYLLIPIGAGLAFFGYRLVRGARETERKQTEAEAAAKMQTGSSPADVSPVVPLDPLSLEIGYALIPLVDKDKGAELLERVTRIRREAALDLGLVVPSIRIIDNMTLDPSEYSFKIRGIEVGRSKIKMGCYMCLDTGSVVEEIKGEATVDPAFGVPALWVGEDMRQQAENAGYAVVDPPTIIATHLTEIIRSHAADILSRQEVAKIIDEIRKTNEVVVKEVMDTYHYTYGEIEKVLQGLLREQVSVRNIVAILETLANYGAMQHNTWFLIEKVREALGLQICLQYVDQERKLSVLQLDQSSSEKILQHQVIPNDGGQPFVAFDPVDGRKWISAVSASIAAVRERNMMPIILCAGEVRALVHHSIDREMPGTVVLSINEVMAAGHAVQLEILGEIHVD
ncbi:MAG: flagellar biosynthesis protein FlhA [Treponemataceae bacterium]|nr:flagellar biosynthesis protein FlhA [Treponemataceae bacterium]